MTIHYTSNESQNKIPYGYCHCGCGQKTTIATKNLSKRGWIKGQPLPYYVSHHGKAKTLEQRFWEKVNKSNSENACWIWTGTKYSDGYGSIKVNRSMVGAHRVSWELAYGEIPEGLCVLHDCPDGDNPSCVNPKHLWLGTKKNNRDDMVNKGRENIVKGEANGMHKYTNDQVTEMRRLRKEENLKPKEIAQIFGATVGHVNKILRYAIRKP